MIQLGSPLWEKTQLRNLKKMKEELFKYSESPRQRIPWCGHNNLIHENENNDRKLKNALKYKGNGGLGLRGDCGCDVNQDKEAS